MRPEGAPSGLISQIMQMRNCSYRRNPRHLHIRDFIYDK